MFYLYMPVGVGSSGIFMIVEASKKIHANLGPNSCFFFRVQNFETVFDDDRRRTPVIAKSSNNHYS